MIQRNRQRFLCTLLLLFSGLLNAATDLQLEAIRTLGDLNGVALSCDRLEQVQQMKQAMVETLPRLRELGALFDQATNDRFISFTPEQTCPVKSEFQTQIAQAIKELKEQFKRVEK